LTLVRFMVLLLGTLAAGAIVALAWKEGFDPEDRQRSVLTTLATATGWSAFSLLWWTFVSGMSWKTRLRGLTVVFLLIASLAFFYEYDGLDGDFVPRIRLRFATVDVVRPERELVSTTAAWPGFQGPHRDATVSDVVLATDWQDRPPQLCWRIEVGRGWSSFAIAQGRAITQEQHGDEEQVVCYDLMTSEVLWKVRDETGYRSGVAGDGPRATPTIEDGLVFTLGATGVLRATELQQGTEVWRRDLHEEGAAIPKWGFSASPLWHDGQILIPVGGAGKMVAAFDARSGEMLWAHGDDLVAYASCAIHRFHGVDQIVLFHHSAVSGHDLQTGQQLWSEDWSLLQPNVAQPLDLGGNRLLVSSGYGSGSVALEVQPAGEGWQTEVIWRSRRLKSKFSNMLLHEGSVYGLDDGIMTCVDPGDGSRRWKDGRDGHGQLLRAGEHILVLTEYGEVVLIDPDPAERRVLGSFQALSDETWNPPSLAAPYLLVRNGREAAAWELPLAGVPRKSE